MGESAMMGKAESWAAETAENVQIRSLRGEGECERGQRGLAVESGAAHACTGQEVGDRFQGLKDSIWLCQLLPTAAHQREAPKASVRPEPW